MSGTKTMTDLFEDESTHGRGAPPMLLFGCIADDYTGATDVVFELQRRGLTTVLRFGTTDDDVAPPRCDAAVVALRTRSAPPDVAVQASLRASKWLLDSGASRLYFKYCSTFDSTEMGNIGPVADALLDQSGSPMTVVCPASPAQGRTIYQGYLFVREQLLEDSPMRYHSTTPMTDSRISRLLGAQSTKTVGVVPLRTVREGPDAIRTQVESLSNAGDSYAVLDALDDADLTHIAQAAAAMPLATGAAPLAGAIAGFLAQKQRATVEREFASPTVGNALIVAGSCSETTRRQVAAVQRKYPSHRLDPIAHPDESEMKSHALKWLDAHLHESVPLLVFSSATPDQQREARHSAGDNIGRILEDVLADVTRHAVRHGRNRIITAGGETAGSVVDAIGVQAVVVGREQAPGVPWLWSESDDLWLLLKSGNYGADDLLVRAAEAVAE